MIEKGNKVTKGDKSPQVVNKTQKPKQKKKTKKK